MMKNQNRGEISGLRNYLNMIFWDSKVIHETIKKFPFSKQVIIFISKQKFYSKKINNFNNKNKL
jgi:hypothetical protein